MKKLILILLIGLTSCYGTLEGDTNSEEFELLAKKVENKFG
jgi:hypothetical protein